MLGQEERGILKVDNKKKNVRETCTKTENEFT